MTKCDQCDYQCATSRYMKTHKAVKHDGLFHKCQDCQFTTGDLGSLRSHRRAKHEGVVYSCDQCEFKSGYKNNLKNHKAVAHFTVDGLNVFSKSSFPKQSEVSLDHGQGDNFSLPQYSLPKVPEVVIKQDLGDEGSQILNTSWKERR